ncbi:hypothetical protein EMCRGX_G027549 [Ephydatia muelleri]|eukprot:Em0020g1029a
MASALQESQVLSFCIFKPELGQKEGKEHLKLLYYKPEDETTNRKVRNIGLCEAIINFTKTFSPDKPCEAVHTNDRRQVFFEPESGIWMVLTVSVPSLEIINNGDRSMQRCDKHVQDVSLQAALRKSYSMFKLFNGTFLNIEAMYGVENLKKKLEKFYSKYINAVEVSKLDIFSVLQGIQFLPLDKIMYLKVHSFVNLIETTFRNILHSVFLYGDQLVWSGLEQDDTKIFYQYLLGWLFPSQLGSDYLASLLPSTALQQSLQQSVTLPLRTGSAAMKTGSFLGLGEGKDAKMSIVYITVDGKTSIFRLLVYTIGGATLCMFIENEKGSPGELCRRLETFISPRLLQLSQHLVEFSNKPRLPSLEQPYRYVYFNEMNLAVKSPLMYRQMTTLPPDMMRLLVEINLDYDWVEEGETVIRTMVDYWLVARKSGHRRFMVLLNQRSSNFSEINEEIKRLCQREFINIFFLD